MINPNEHYWESVRKVLVAIYEVGLINIDDLDVLADCLREIGYVIYSILFRAVVILTLPVSVPLLTFIFRRKLRKADERWAKIKDKLPKFADIAED
jgi:hypothetical protein